MQSLRHEPSGSVSGIGPLLSLTALVKLCSTPWGLEEYSPLVQHNFLLLDIEGVPLQSQHEQLGGIVDCLRQLPCPVIAVGARASPTLLKGVDVVVGSAREARPLLKNINDHPLAAMTLVQLLRHNEEVTPEQGLLAESFAYATLQGNSEPQHPMMVVPDRVLATEQSQDAILLERKNDELHVVLNRPHARNAYSARMRDALYAALQLLKMDGSLSKAIVSGAGSCFCVGGDLNEFGVVPDASTGHAIRSSRSVGKLLLELGPRLEFRLHRACVGAGIELPAFASRVVAGSSTFMQLPEIRLGLLPGAGGTVSIPARIGRHRAAYLALSARRITAVTALQWGLIDEIC